MNNQNHQVNTSQSQTILVVDDTPENIDVLVGLLTPKYKIKVALNGEKAIKIAMAENPPDLILLDIMMPGMDGYNVCRILKAEIRTRHIPIIFVTAKGEVLDETRGFQVGAVDYITKPISPPIVVARVATHLALQDQNRELEIKVKERTAELKETRFEIIHRLGIAAEYKDNETGMHVIRMSHYCKLIGLKAGMSHDEADMLQHAAPMHDVGKIGIPDSILLKPGKLDKDEWETMKTHSKIGNVIIGDHESEILKLAGMVALSHHEKWDGSGYPNGLKGEDIPLMARIVAVADVYDALTSKRPYKKAWPEEDAIAEIKKLSGSHFEPRLVEAFLEVLPDIYHIKEKYTDT